MPSELVGVGEPVRGSSEPLARDRNVASSGVRLDREAVDGIDPGVACPRAWVGRGRDGQGSVEQDRFAALRTNDLSERSCIGQTDLYDRPMAETRHVWTLDGSAYCDAARIDDVGTLRPPRAPDAAAEMCGGCVMAAEIFISAVRGTVLASRPPSITAAAALDSLAGTRWSQVANLAQLRTELDDGRSMYLYGTDWGK